MQVPPRLTNATLMSDIVTEWTLNASLTRLSSYRKCSKRRILGHSAQATSPLPIEGMTKCSRTAHGFGSGSDTGSVADLSLPRSHWAILTVKTAQKFETFQSNRPAKRRICKDFEHPPERITDQGSRSSPRGGCPTR